VKTVDNSAQGVLGGAFTSPGTVGTDGWPVANPYVGEGAAIVTIGAWRGSRPAASGRSLCPRRFCLYFPGGNFFLDKYFPP